MNIIESMKLAIDSVIVNKLRALLTLLSISIGVFAIIISGSLVNSLNETVSGELAEMGENSFGIYRMPKIQMGPKTWRKYRKREPITYSQYKTFKERVTLTNLVNSYSASGDHTVKYGTNETDPDIVLIGTDETYFLINNKNVIKGRAFTNSDIRFNKNVAIVGNDLVVELFPNTTDPVGKEIKIKNQKFEVIGILEEQGAILGQSQDNQVIIPLTFFLKYYASWWEESLQINVRANSRDALMPTIDEAIGIMRSIREVKPWEDNDFELETNESLRDQFADFTGFISIFGMICGIIALIAAGVGIMNIMLVAVKERTREIGIRKAVGAKKSWILMQFIIETITLCQIGGLIGIIFGTLGGNVLGSMAGFTLSIPVFWIVVSIIICTVIGLIFGLFPAWKAANLDPIDALRYE